MVIEKQSNKIINWLNSIWRVLDNGKITRRITVIWMLWITTEVFMWSMDFAATKPSSIDLAATLGAILTPLVGLHAAIFNFYIKSNVDLKKEHE